MADEAKLRRILAEGLDVPESAVADDASADTMEAWDSLAHMSVILAVEEEFDIEIPDDEAADLSSLSLLRFKVDEAGRGRR